MVPSLVSLFILCSLVQEMECNASCLLIIACVIDLYSQPATPHLHVGIFKIKEKYFAAFQKIRRAACSSSLLSLCPSPNPSVQTLVMQQITGYTLSSPLPMSTVDPTDHSLLILFSPLQLHHSLKYQHAFPVNTSTEEVSKTSNTQPSHSLKTQEIENKKNMHPNYNHTKLQMPRHQQNTISKSQDNPEKTQASGENKSFKKSNKQTNN